MNRHKRKITIINTAIVMLWLIIISCMPFGSTLAENREPQWPLPSNYKTITTEFDSRRNERDSGYHNGIDIAADYGTPIYAILDGTVVCARTMGDYGNMVVVYHEEQGIYSFYAHASSILSSEGQYVHRGDVLAKVGSTGVSTGNHLHFGICDHLINSWPTITYYDPLAFLAGSISIPGPSDECGCTEANAGTYTTRNVDNYLNIRSGHGTQFGIVGTIPAGAHFTVTKDNGSWAHVEYQGVKGYCSVEYITKISDTKSDMSISGETIPTGVLEYGSFFIINGKITSSLPISKVWGGVYDANYVPTAQYGEAQPMTTTYDLATYFDYILRFGQLECGDYIYAIQAQDTSGEVYKLIESGFAVQKKEVPPQTGDLDNSGDINMSDIVLMQRFLIGRNTLTPERLAAADLDGNNQINVFDLILIKRLVFSKNL